MKILSVFGTRPEAVKMAPLVLRLQSDNRFESRVCVTGQHRQMLDAVLQAFSILPSYDLDVMRPSQGLEEITAKVLVGMSQVIDSYRPDVVLVHGDTSTTFAAALAAFFRRVPVGHVEAGLRTGNIYSPWPEEANRKLTATIASFHFAPTEGARVNLLKEGVDSEKVAVTGNTVVDALIHTRNKLNSDPALQSKVSKQFQFLARFSRSVLVTGHRRESFGGGFERICEALARLAIRFPDVAIVYPVHLNPNVAGPVHGRLNDIENIFLIPPLDYLPFVYLMERVSFVLTDSGGIQEEAPSLGKPVLVMRDTTERPEVLEAGAALLVGTTVSGILDAATKLITDESIYRRMANAPNPFGDGRASERIVDILADAKFG